MRALVVLLLLAGMAHAEERELCTRGAVFRGPANRSAPKVRAVTNRSAPKVRAVTIDLDVKDADLHDVYRLLSDVGRVNIVISGDVKAKVTLRLKRVAWQQVACAIAGVHKLQILVNGNVLLVRAAGSR